MKTEMDPGLLKSGWAGNLGPDEYEFDRENLSSDPDLAFGWGFKPKGKRRSEDAIRRVAMDGDPDSRTHNLKLVRGESTGVPNPGVEEPVSDRVLEVLRPEVTKGACPQGRRGIDSLSNAAHGLLCSRRSPDEADALAMTYRPSRGWHPL